MAFKEQTEFSNLRLSSLGLSIFATIAIIFGVSLSGPSTYEDKSSITSFFGETRSDSAQNHLSTTEFIWLEAELFNDLGGWKVDSQFISTVGSSYLLASGLGKPVEDARTTFHISRSGQFKIWVRSKNWLPRFNPGQFQIGVDETTLPFVCGMEASGKWVWEEAGVIALSAGKHSIILKDLTGDYGRCDVILLTDNQGFIPPQSPEELHSFRKKFVDNELTPDDLKSYDIVVIGGGIGGVCAALAAAREGRRVALIQNRPVLGGNASSEIGVLPVGASAIGRNRYSRETGLFEELYFQYVRLGSWDRALLEAVKNEPKIHLFLNHHATRAIESSPSRIEAVETLHTITGKRDIFRGKIFIDCTGDGDVAVSAGAEFRMGREGREEFKEDLAQTQTDSRVMSATLMFHSEKSRTPTSFQPPPWAYDFPFCADLPERDHGLVQHGYYWISYGGDMDPLQQGEEIRDELFRILYGVWDHLKNHCPESKDKFSYQKLSRVQYILGKRESRRLIGDYILSQSDIENRVQFEDRVAYGGWPIDLHPPKGIFDPGPSTEQSFVKPYSIPFRCLYSRNIDNLLFAGRHISVSHVALGSTRVMATIATCGQAVGTAAALCFQHNLSPRELGTLKIAELQRMLLKNDARILGLKDDDPKDLARQARVKASSFAEPSYKKEDNRPIIGSHPLNFPRAVMFLATENRVENVHVFLESSLAEPCSLSMELRCAPDFEVFKIKENSPVMTANALVPPKGRHWVNFRFGSQVQPGEYYWVVLPATPGISWLLTNNGAPWSVRAARSAIWESYGGYAGVYCFALDPPLHFKGTAPQSIIDGWKYPAEGKFNLWVSDPALPLPQWIELDFQKRVAIHSIYLYFDTNLDLFPPLHQPRSPSCVRRYQVQIPSERGWKTVVDVNDNWMRFRKHTFETVISDKLRILVLATNGDPSARIYEVHVYGPGN